MAWLGTSVFQWALERPHNVPTTPTPACQRHDRQRHLRAPQPAQGAITGASAKPIFIQANGPLERDYWGRQRSFTPVVGASDAHYHGISLICGFRWFTVIWRAEIGSFFVTMPWVHDAAARHICKDCPWLTRTGIPEKISAHRSCKITDVTRDVTSQEGCGQKLELGSMIKEFILQERNCFVSVCLKMLVYKMLSAI